MTLGGTILDIHQDKLSSKTLYIVRNPKYDCNNLRIKLNLSNWKQLEANIQKLHIMQRCYRYFWRNPIETEFCLGNPSELPVTLQGFHFRGGMGGRRGRGASPPPPAK